MPKLSNTKKQRAEELLRKLNIGPYLNTLRCKELTKEEAERQVKIWLETWIIPEIEELIPELKNR